MALGTKMLIVFLKFIAQVCLVSEGSKIDSKMASLWESLQSPISQRLMIVIIRPTGKNLLMVFLQKSRFKLVSCVR